MIDRRLPIGHPVRMVWDDATWGGLVGVIDEFDPAHTEFYCECSDPDCGDFDIFEDRVTVTLNLPESHRYYQYGRQGKYQIGMMELRYFEAVVP